MKIQYRFYKLLTSFLSVLPWSVIGTLSKGISFLIYKVVFYRRKVVERNISKSFPNLSQDEQDVIVSGFYYHLVYVFLSSPKLLSLSPKELKEKHLLADDLSVFEELKQQGKKHCIIMMGHCGNWELFSAGQIYLDDFGLRQEQLYRPLNNQAFDEVQKEMRSRFGSISTPKSQIGRRMIELVRNPESEATVFAFISDQTPSFRHVGLWSNFLNQETAFLDGAERLAKKFDLPVVYLDIYREKDAVYRASFKLVTAEPQATSQGEITQTFVNYLEETIRRKPTDWLWSHKRWKFSRQEVEKALSK